MWAFLLDHKDTPLPPPHLNISLTLASPLSTVSRQNPNLGVFSAPKERKHLLSPHNTKKKRCKTPLYWDPERVFRWANLTQKASGMSGGFNSTIMSVSWSQHSFIQQAFNNITSSRRWRCRWEQDQLSERSLPSCVSVWILEKRKETD